MINNNVDAYVEHYVWICGHFIDSPYTWPIIQWTHLVSRLNLMEEELIVLRSRSHMVDAYEREIRRLRDELIRLTISVPKSSLLNGSVYPPASAN